MQKRVEYLIDHEEVRGATPRYWEDVKVGDELQTLVKGPLSIGEMWAWSQGLGGGGEVHAFKMRSLRKHPAWGWKNPDTGARKRLTRCMNAMMPPRESRFRWLTTSAGSGMPGSDNASRTGWAMTGS